MEYMAGSDRLKPWEIISIQLDEQPTTLEETLTFLTDIIGPSKTLTEGLELLTQLNPDISRERLLELHPAVKKVLADYDPNKGFNEGGNTSYDYMSIKLLEGHLGIPIAQVYISRIKNVFGQVISEQIQEDVAVLHLAERFPVESLAQLEPLKRQQFKDALLSSVDMAYKWLQDYNNPSSGKKKLG